MGKRRGGKRRWFRAHVEQCLARAWGLDKVRRDDDGDYPFRSASALAFVRIERGAPFVRVFTQCVRGVPCTKALLREINEVNAKCRTARVYWEDGAVYSEQTLHASGVTRRTLDQACGSVVRIADDLGVLLASMYGGETMFPVDADAVGGRP